MKRCFCVSLLALALAGCLGGGGTGGGAASASGGSSGGTSQGIATPSSVSVVTATD